MATVGFKFLTCRSSTGMFSLVYQVRICCCVECLCMPICCPESVSTGSMDFNTFCIQIMLHTWLVSVGLINLTGKQK
uniref:Uncharacterized protein n=1 Tax=Anguilla anguilla TaxID=7936 RepID=A0A0E9X755_ANGAN